MRYATGQWQPWRQRLGGVIAACLSVTAAFALGGCFLSGGREADDKYERMLTIAAEIETKLAALPGVVQVKVAYADDITNPGVAAASIQVTAGTSFPPVQDEALRLIWQSRLDPLKNIHLAVVDAADRWRNEVLHLDARGKDKADLERKYGPRPE